MRRIWWKPKGKINGETQSLGEERQRHRRQNPKHKKIRKVTSSAHHDKSSKGRAPLTASGLNLPSFQRNELKKPTVLWPWAENNSNDNAVLNQCTRLNRSFLPQTCLPWHLSSSWSHNTRSRNQSSQDLQKTMTKRQMELLMPQDLYHHHISETNYSSGPIIPQDSPSFRTHHPLGQPPSLRSPKDSPSLKIP